MVTAGIDVGAQNVKVAILSGARLLSYSVVSTGWDTASALRCALQEATEKAGIREEEVHGVAATGMGRDSVSFATVHLTDARCSARGAVWSVPLARTVVDIGAERSQALTCDGDGKVLEYVRNDSCAAGAGAFIEEMASALEVNVEDIGRFSLSSSNTVVLNSTCTVFAESEVVSLMSQGTNKKDIARAICDAIGAKAASLLRGLNVQKQVVCIGGVALNAGVVASLRERLNLEIIVPDEPRIVTAVGACLLAQQAEDRRSGAAC